MDFNDNLASGIDPDREEQLFALGETFLSRVSPSLALDRAQLKKEYNLNFKHEQTVIKKHCLQFDFS